MKQDKKLNVRQEYTRFVKETLGEDLGKLNDKQRTLALTEFYIMEIHNRLRGNISEEDFDEGYVDAGGDVGVDFIHRDDNQVLIIQAKYTKEGGRADIKDIQHFQAIFTRSTDTSFKKNLKLADALSEVDFENDTFVLRFITLGKIDGQAREQTLKEPSLSTIIPGLQDRVSFEWSDESDLTQDIRNAFALITGIPGECVLVSHGSRGKRAEILELESGGYRSFIIVVSAMEIVQLYNRFKDTLFTLNIRNYIGRTTTNKGIMKAASESPDYFYHYNNGISCLGTSVEVVNRGDRLKVKGLQVINGAQTVKALHRANQQKPWKIPSTIPLVLVRVTEVSKGYGEAGRFAEDTVRYNNTQNVIKASDFRSNDPVQRDLKERFNKVVRFGRNTEYMPKRTEGSKRNTWIVRMEEFSKVIYSFLEDPISFSGSTSYLFDDSEQGGYRVVFGDGKHIWDKMPEDEFHLRSAVWWMGEVFAERRKSDRDRTTDPVEKGALERKWMLIYAARLVLEISFGPKYRSQMMKFYRGDWKLGQDTDGEWFEELYERAKSAVIFVYGEAAKHKDDFVHRNWMRSPETVQALKDVVNRLPGFKLRGATTR